MATKAMTMEYLLDRIQKMFGEYALYCDGKVIGFVCDDQLYLKLTEPDKAFAPGIVLAPPYPGAKDYFLIDPDQWERRDWLCQFVHLTFMALPTMKPKWPKSKKS